VPIAHTVVVVVGQEDYDRLRPLSYSNANVFLVCFSIGNRASFENVADKWTKELRKYAAGVPIVLVGTQGDRRAQGMGDMVSTKEAKKMAKAIRATQYVECSALSRDGLKDVFFGAITAAIMPKQKASSIKCVII
jgi:small GTP-binding protein